jgi:hypothetical protein
MRCDGSMSSTAWLEGRQVPSLLSREKGEEKLLPTCVHGHVAKSTQHVLMTGCAARLASLGSVHPSLALCHRRIGGRRPAGVGGVLVHVRFERCEAFEKSQDQQADTQGRLLPTCGREVEPVRKQCWIMSITHDGVSFCLVSFFLSQNRCRVSRKVRAAKSG